MKCKKNKNELKLSLFKDDFSFDLKQSKLFFSMDNSHDVGNGIPFQQVKSFSMQKLEDKSFLEMGKVVKVQRHHVKSVSR